ncbi:MAG: peptidoglycan DD-metalloendopeptidase family protein [Gammaproteobacteria bacterium]
MRAALIIPLLVLLYGCTTVKAPVSSRGTAPEPAPTISRPGGAVVTRPPVPVSRPANGADGHYSVRRGDTLYSVAWQHGLTVGELAGQNRIHPPYTIYPGQRLRVSGPTHAVAPIRIQPLPDRQAAQPAGPKLAVKPAPAPAPKPVPQPVARQPVKPASAPDPRPAEPAPVAAQSPGPGGGYDGSWAWPTRGRVLRGFQPNGTSKKGIDIGGHHAQPVKAAAGGKVVYAGSGLVGYGRLIIVKHNENLLSAYGHNSKLLVAEGDPVSKGDTIAKMGNSGTNRTALYFEIRKDGKPVNPMQYLPRN